MTDVELYLYEGCSSCRDARALLAKLGLQVKEREFFKDRLSVSELSTLFARIGTTPTAMLATRSRPYQALGLTQRSLTDQEIVELMAEYPALVRRPIVAVGSRGQAGFNRVAIEQMAVEAREGDNGNA